MKGLEFDHSVILNAEELDARVVCSVTRASKSLTVFSSTRILAPPL